MDNEWIYRASIDQMVNQDAWMVKILRHHKVGDDEWEQEYLSAGGEWVSYQGFDVIDPLFIPRRAMLEESRILERVEATVRDLLVRSGLTLVG